ncbi:MAG TPA: hypothetical protein VKS22_17355 [Candidatus Binataceae bacterium]|nr:hypothetical protein [Candidatus Binataceae bacterium]
MTSSATVWMAALMLVASVALFVAAPLTEVFSARRRETDEEARGARLQHERGLATAALRELDFDHEMGKIDDDDYHALRTRLETRALAAMSGLSELSDLSTVAGLSELSALDGPALSGADAPARTAAAGGIKPCPRCATPAAADYLFCPRCGATLERPVDLPAGSSAP